MMELVWLVDICGHFLLVSCKIEALQSWAQVLVLGVMIVGALVYQTHYIDKVIEGLRNELKAEIAGLRAEMNQRFNNVDTRLDRLEHPVIRG
jgi:hypothetical protein